MRMRFLRVGTFSGILKSSFLFWRVFAGEGVLRRGHKYPVVGVLLHSMGYNKSFNLTCGHTGFFVGLFPFGVRVYSSNVCPVVPASRLTLRWMHEK